LGAIKVNGQRLVAGDAVKLRGVRELSLARGEAAEVLLFDLRPNETPRY
ncbi:MAG TPA: quercetin 2,3-dioxygenase, partial [Rhodocyclaceae bacterium]|nr:quercetin 2,3-dioxygenase [Rhodocyclaceae bacterium]